MFARIGRRATAASAKVFAALAIWFMCFIPVSLNAATMYVMTNGTEIYSVDTTSSVLTHVASVTSGGGNVQDLAENIAGVFYFTDSAGTLYKYDPANPNAGTQTIGSTGLGSLARLSFDNAGNLITVNGGNLYVISPVTGTTLNQYAITGAPAVGGGDVVVAASGLVYVIAGDALYSLRESGGTVTPVGVVAGPTNNLTGLAIDPAGDLYACETMGPPWNLWKFSSNSPQTATKVGSYTTTGTPNDLASLPIVPFLTITKTASTQAAQGDLIGYSVLVQNSGTAAASNTAFSDPVPTGIGIVSAKCTTTGGATCTAPSITAQNVTSSFGTLPPATTITIAINGKDNSLPVGNSINTATITPSTGSPLSSSATTTIVPNSVLKTVADITQGTPATTANNAKPGDVLEYSFTYTNNTQTALANFTMKDSIPAHTTYVSGSAACVGTPSGLTCTPSGPTGGTIQWTYGNGALAPNGSVTAKFRVTVN
ncbi:MAG: DUF11 domain-containing protein [Candidatus Eremiobacteraeota bacterium]|nr:DUF11 domain-containing protein [Candidatus Eremiobacteraeota bacterium]